MLATPRLVTSLLSSRVDFREDPLHVAGVLLVQAEAHLPKVSGCGLSDAKMNLKDGQMHDNLLN
jgi:hypothetical protein